MENAALTDKKRIKKHLEELIIPKLRDFDIAGAEQKMKRCKESNYTDCESTSYKIFQKQ